MLKKIESRKIKNPKSVLVKTARVFERFSSRELNRSSSEDISNGFTIRTKSVENNLLLEIPDENEFDEEAQKEIEKQAF